MIVKSLELKNYRNYNDLYIEFDKQINVLYGDNAQGKTNILEAIYLCSTTKSHKGSKDKDIIKFEQQEAHICLKVEKKNVERKINIHLKKNKSKGVAIDGLIIKKSSELFGTANVIFFSPEDLNIIKNGPSERRKFIDIELCQLDKIYLHHLSNYNKVINQRNNLLKQIPYNPSLKETLDVWDMQLVDFGQKIIARREQLIHQLNNIINRIHQNLSGKKEILTLIYEPNVKINEFEKKLFEKRDYDIKYKTTTVGPHRDDICFLVNDIDIRTFGSQGQQRTAALSLKLSEIEIVKELVNDTPILLLDDVLSELDSHRQNYLLGSLKDIQTIITCTGLDEFVQSSFSINKIQKIVNGTLVKDLECKL